MHVWPNDLDLNLHVNNSRYLSYCDLGKVDLMLRAGVGRLALVRKWQPIVGGCLIRFRFSLRVFQRITVVTRVLCWDEKWFYALHLIESRRGVAAVALAKTSVRDRDGVVAPGAVLKGLGFAEPSPPPPEPVLQWIATEETLHVEERC
jgi:acyl-CoA thioesterase FadM